MNSPDTEQTTPTGYQIDDLVVNTGTHEVSRDGQVLKLPALSYRMLVVLAQAAPDMLSTDELITQVWQGRIVSNETVTQRIKLLRQAIGDNAQQPRYIGLVRAGGYRILAPVTELSSPVPTASATQQQRKAAVKLLIPALLAVLIGSWFWLQTDTAPESEVVALLPFTHGSDDPELARLSNSLNDELRDRLRAAGLKMVARGSSMVFSDTPYVVTEAARRLGSTRVILGELSQTDQQLLIDLTLVDGRTGVEQWSQRFTFEAANLDLGQRQMAHAVAEQLDLNTSELSIGTSTNNPAAYNLILLARHFEQNIRDQLSMDTETLDRAISLYRQATQLDPGSAMAYSRLAGALLYQGDVNAARPAIFRALDLNPNLADVQYTLGLYYWRTGDDQGGEAFARAVELDPNHPEALAAHAKWIWHQQDFDAPGEFFERAREVDPLALERYSDLGTFYAYQNDPAATVAVARQVAQRFDTPQAMEVIARLYELAGALDEAVAWAWRGRLQTPAAVPDPNWQLAELYGRLGMHAHANALVPEADISKLFWQRRYAELIDVAEEAIIEQPDDAKIYYQLAFAYSTQDLHAAAVRILELAGLPERALSDSRRADAVEAMATYASALAEIGEISRARQAAGWHRHKMQTARDTRAGDSWWPNLYQACALMVLGQEAQALARLSALSRSHALAWEPLLRDAVCFRSLESSPAYQAVVNEQLARKAALREKLPVTLAEYGLEAVDGQLITTQP
ncbi:MAG: winged helix-turn-helix domain-containing protein [Pseudomonadales bacterium]